MPPTQKRIDDIAAKCRRLATEAREREPAGRQRGTIQARRPTLAERLGMN